jgi:hypothetical protein
MILQINKLKNLKNQKWEINVPKVCTWTLVMIQILIELHKDHNFHQGKIAIKTLRKIIIMTALLQQI